MKRPSRVPMRAAIAAVLTLAMAMVALVMWHTSRAMHSAAEDVRAEHEFRFVARPLVPALNAGFEVVSSPQVLRQAARFQDHLYVAGPAGLAEYAPDGSPLQQYVVGRDLPGSPLVALAPAVLADS